MSGDEPNAVTRLLLEWRGGDKQALDRLLPHVYDELRRQARNCMRGERSGHTLQTTALVHEAYGRLVNMEVPWKDRIHFFAVAARSMRRILVDHARSKSAAKRGAGQAPLPLEEAAAVTAEPSLELIELDRCLDRLAGFDERRSRFIELHFFGGLTYEEIAAAEDSSPATIHREMRLARAWLRREMEAGRDPA